MAMIYTPQNHELRTTTFKIPNMKHNNINKILIITFSSLFNFSNEKCLHPIYIMTTLHFIDKIENHQSTIAMSKYPPSIYVLCLPTCLLKNSIHCNRVWKFEIVVAIVDKKIKIQAALLSLLWPISLNFNNVKLQSDSSSKTNKRIRPSCFLLVASLLHTPSCML